MKGFTIIKCTFSLVGIGILAVAVFLYRGTNSFLEGVAQAEGTVIELVRSRSSDSITYHPVVQFTSQEGEAVGFFSSTSSNPPSYSRGEWVEVLYHPEEPQKSKINSFFSLWGGPVMLGGLGGVFFLLGSGLIFISVRKARKNEFLKRSGVIVEAELQSVVINRSLIVNGRHPFRVVAQWQNPRTSELHVFESENVWFDPSAYMKGSKIKVFIDKDDPRKYYVDLLFLPKLAK